MREICQGFVSGDPARFPIKTRKLKRRHEAWWLAILTSLDVNGHVCVWLERRAEKGIWAGLYCSPVLADEDRVLALAMGVNAEPDFLDPVAHSLTHKELRLHPVLMRVDSTHAWTSERDGRWVRIAELAAWGLPAPLRPLLATLPGSS